MKTFLFGIGIGVAIKCLWDSEYGLEWRTRVVNRVQGILSSVDDKILHAEAAIENAAIKVDRAMDM